MKKDFDEMEQFRCTKCNKLLFKYKLKGCLSLKIKCTRCNSYFSTTINRSDGTVEEYPT